MQQSIKHIGTVVLVEQGYVRVSVLAQSACSSCHAKSVCMSGDQSEKLIDVYNPEGSYAVGDRVEVEMLKGSGWRAVLIAYVIPFVILMVTLLGAIKAEYSEPLSALISLVSVSVYYFIVYMLRDKISNKIRFNIHKL